MAKFSLLEGSGEKISYVTKVQYFPFSDMMKYWVKYITA
jgi:hypothetical protein